MDTFNPLSPNSDENEISLYINCLQIPACYDTAFKTKQMSTMSASLLWNKYMQM